MNHERWMEAALEHAREAYDRDEVPVGAVVVSKNRVVAGGRNRMAEKGFPFEHAEVVAMWAAIERHDRFVLEDSVVYVTVEPCVMCVGAMLLARVPLVVYGAREPRTGACESVLSIPNEPRLEHRLSFLGGVMEGPAGR